MHSQRVTDEQLQEIVLMIDEEFDRARTMGAAWPNLGEDFVAIALDLRDSRLRTAALERERDALRAALGKAVIALEASRMGDAVYRGIGPRFDHESNAAARARRTAQRWTLLHPSAPSPPRRTSGALDERF